MVSSAEFVERTERCLKLSCSEFEDSLNLKMFGWSWMLAVLKMQPSKGSPSKRFTRIGKQRLAKWWKCFCDLSEVYRVVSLQKKAVSLTEIAVGRSYDLLRCGSNAYRFSPRQSKEFAHMSGRLTELKRHSSFWLQFFITKMHLINGWWCFNFLIIIFSHYDVNDRSLGSDWFCKQLVVLQSQKMCYLKAPVILKFNGFYWTVSIRHSSQSLLADCESL